MAKQKLNQQQIDGAIVATGFVNGPTTTGIKTLTQESNIGLTYNGTTTYTIVTKGIYMIHVQQLCANGADTYLQILINGGAVRHAFIPSAKMADYNVSEMRELNVGDTISFYQLYAATTVWGNQHSGYQIYLIKRTD
jgi:hypothetical protein